MDPRKDNLESLLATLGEAHQAGAFKSDAARYPWQLERVEAQSPGHRRFAWFWVGGPLTAAAAVAILFVGPHFFSQQAARKIAMTVQTNLQPVQPKLHVAEVVPTTRSSIASRSSINCRDYNGDGVVDGGDIQGFVDHLRDTGGDPQTKEEFVQRCLLGG
ncbi:MAG: hypothetical protein ACE5EQ_10295 [Phycisphaerae bacterium]